MQFRHESVKLICPGKNLQKNTKLVVNDAIDLNASLLAIALNTLDKLSLKSVRKNVILIN